MKKFFTLALAALVLVTGLPVLGSQAVKQAEAAEAAPQVEFFMVDTGVRAPTLGDDCQSASQRFGWGASVRDTIDNDNSDCAKIRITNPSSRYDQDFRICFGLGNGNDEAARCTPWASEGGGGTGIRASYYDWAIGYMVNWTESRPLTGGGYIENARVGLQWYELPDGGSCGASGGIAWASQAQPESGWTWGGPRDNDPGCAQMYLQASYSAPYITDVAGENISAATLIANTDYPVEDGYRIIMRNLGHVWNSTTNVRQIGNCDSYEAGPNAGTCSYTKVLSAPNIKLVRVDQEPFTFNPSPLPYQQQVSVTHTSIHYVQTCSAPLSKGMFDDFFGIQKAHAAINPADLEPEDPTEPCVPYDTWVENIVETPASAIIAPETATFPASFRTPAAGTYTLRFQLQKTDGAAAGTNAEGFFGPEVSIPVTIGVPPNGASIGISCPVAEVTVSQGETASYAVTIGSQNGFTGPVAITPSGMPAGATSPGATVQVPANGSASGIVPISVAPTTPPGDTTITFTGTGEGVTPVTCTSLLRVTRTDGAPTLRVSPASTNVRIGDQAQFRAFYDADGSGTQSEIEVTQPAMWTVAGGVASLTGQGQFRGEAVGRALPRVTYNGLSASATLNVTDTIDEVGRPTFSVRPTSRTIAVGDTVEFDAYYDPDGAGVRPELEVSDSSSWTVSPASVASNGDNGRFTGMATGTAVVTATYRPDPTISDVVRGTATLIVSGPGSTNSCSFTANPATLFVPPPRSTTLSWQCGVPTTCTVTNLTAGTVVTTGGQSGTGQSTPAVTSRYRLSCEGGIQQDLTVRVFDVTTRIEILPQ